MDISLEIRQRREKPCFGKERIVAPGLDYPSLVAVYRTERAASETSPVAHEAETDLLDSGHSSVFLIHRMIRPRIGKTVDVVHLFFRQRKSGRVLNDKGCTVTLGHRSAVKGILFEILEPEGLGKFHLLGGGFFERGDFHHAALFWK